MHAIMPLLCNAAVTGEAANSSLRRAFSSLWKSAGPRARLAALSALGSSNQRALCGSDRAPSAHERHGSSDLAATPAAQHELDVATDAPIGRAKVASLSALRAMRATNSAAKCRRQTTYGSGCSGADPPRQRAPAKQSGLTTLMGVPAA